MQLIGNTPLVQLAHLVDQDCADVWVKFEGANLWAALQRARELGPGKTVVTVVIDSGLRYLDGELFG